MRKLLITSIAVLAAGLALAGLNYAQEAERPDEEHTEAVEEGEYEYVIASVLDEKQEDYMNKCVKFIDELAVLWDDPTEHDSEEEIDEMKRKEHKGDHDNQTLRESYGYIKFETLYHRCLIPEEYEESVNYLRFINRKKTHLDSEKRTPKPKLLSIYGKLIRSTAWGKVSDEKGGADMGTEPEHVVLMVHKIEEPPERFFKDVAREEEQ